MLVPKHCFSPNISVLCTMYIYEQVISTNSFHLQHYSLCHFHNNCETCRLDNQLVLAETTRMSKFLYFTMFMLTTND